MTKFVFLAHEAPTRGKINLDNLAGEGRVDLIARTINSALLKSHGVREENELYIIIRDKLVVHFDGKKIGGVNPDERSIAGLLNRAIKQQFRKGSEVSDGVNVYDQGLETVLEELDDEIYILREGGKSLPDSGTSSESVFVLSDHMDFEMNEIRVLEEAGAKEVSIGPEIVHSDDSVAVVNNFFDTEGFEKY